MRLLLAILILLVPMPLAAWEFRPDPICTLSHETGEAGLTITFDGSVAEYRLVLRRTDGAFAASQSFGMAFEGGRGLTIGTREHRIDGSTLTVTDRGFGNVLNGLEFNRTATAFTETQSLHFPLHDAAEPVREFRRCTEAAPATS